MNITDRTTGSPSESRSGSAARRRVPAPRTALPSALPPALAIALPIALALGGCADLQRSRNLADPAVPAATLAQQVCSNCHGPDGNASSPNFPNLAGQQAPYIEAQLNGFRGRNRRDPAGYEYMWGLSRSLSDAQIKGLADYYGAQKPRAQPVEGDPARSAAGAKLFAAGDANKSVPPCIGCHGEHGQGNGQFPRIAGQHADYIVKQLTVFQRTDERPEGSVMKVVAHSLDADDIRNLASYLQSIGG